MKRLYRPICPTKTTNRRYLPAGVNDVLATQVLLHFKSRQDTFSWNVLLSVASEDDRAVLPVIDNDIQVVAHGTVRHYLDIVIYDRQYSPVIFARNREQYIPAESVLAAFEVKQNLSRQ